MFRYHTCAGLPLAIWIKLRALGIQFVLPTSLHILIGLLWVASSFDRSYLQVSFCVCCPQAHSKGKGGYKERESTRTFKSRTSLLHVWNVSPLSFRATVALVHWSTLCKGNDHRGVLSYLHKVLWHWFYPFSEPGFRGMTRRVGGEKPEFEMSPGQSPISFSTEGHFCLCLLPDMSFKLKPSVP